MTATKTTEAVKQLHYLAGALKAPRILEVAGRLADQARDAGWTFEDYLAAVLEREVSARNASGAEMRIDPVPGPLCPAAGVLHHQPAGESDGMAVRCARPRQYLRTPAEVRRERIQHVGREPGRGERQPHASIVPAVRQVRLCAWSP